MRRQSLLCHLPCLCRRGVAGKTGEAGEYEDAMLDVAEAERLPSSRLSCQIEASPELDGLVLIVPEP
jgi:2Fe-2S ferredoxin